jgi:hypothetical protein
VVILARRLGKSPAAKWRGLRFDNSLGLTLALVAFKDADLQIVDGMRRSANQMRIAAAIFAAKRLNKFLILHKEGMLVHNPPPTYSASAEHARHPRRPLRTPPSRPPPDMCPWSGQKMARGRRPTR